jgi:PPM family protein phosphatase
MSLLGRSFGDTNPGRKRRRNEDTFVCEPPLFAVADGMGGAQAGEVASAIAATALSGALGHGETVAAPETEQLVGRLIREANRRVHDRAAHDASVSGMGTTMTVALVGSDDLVAIGHVGDSRAYRLREGELEQLTDDHSLVAELVRRGELSPEEAEVHPQRSVITRALGTDPDVDVDVFSVPAQAGDVFLLCSDGLSTMVDGDTISEIVVRNRGDLESATRALIRAANDEGGEDNITAVLFEFAGAPANGGPEPAAAVVPPPARPGADEEDTLHPEDGIPVIEAAAVAAAAPAPESVPEAEPERESTGTELGDTMIVPVSALATAAEPAHDDAAPAGESAGPGFEAEPEEHVPFPVFRAILATLLIIVLAALAIGLALWGLAR